MIGILCMLLINGSDMNTENDRSEVFKFVGLQEQQMMLVNDGVMGGRSNSDFILQDGKARFTGKLSLENNAGFASVRMLWPYINSPSVDTFNVLRLKVRGDGRVYQFRLKTNQGYDGVAYSYSFKTSENKVQAVSISINDFIPTFRGRSLENMPKLKFSDVQQMGVLIADKKTNEFGIDLLELSLNQ